MTLGAAIIECLLLGRPIPVVFEVV